MAMVTVTRHKKYQADALTDAKAVKLFGVLDLRYSWDATFAAPAGESEELAYRLNEIYNEQCEDCTMTGAGMTCELPKSKADQERTGITRDVKHRRGCRFAGDQGLGCSLESAMPRGADGKPDARRRCQVCMKRWLWELQGPRSQRTPSKNRNVLNGGTHNSSEPHNPRLESDPSIHSNQARARRAAGPFRGGWEGPRSGPSRAPIDSGTCRPRRVADGTHAQRPQRAPSSLRCCTRSSSKAQSTSSFKVA